MPALNMAALQRANEVTSTPRRPAGEVGALTAMQFSAGASNAAAERERALAEGQNTRRGRLMSKSEAREKRAQERDADQDVVEEPETSTQVAARPPRPVVAAPAPATGAGDEVGDDDYGDDDFEDYSDDDFGDGGDDGTFDDIDSGDGLGGWDTKKAPVVKSPAVPKAAAAAAPARDEWIVQRRYVPKRSVARSDAAARAEAHRQAERVKSILKDIELQVESFDMLYKRDPEPAMLAHTRRLARGAVRDAATQYNEDWRSRRTQTDRVKTHSIGTQGPEYAGAALTEASFARLPDFVHRAAAVVEALIMEGGRGRGDIWGESGVGAGLLLPRVVSLALPHTFGQRKVMAMHFSASDPSLLLVAYSRAAAQVGGVGGSGGGGDWAKRVLPRKALLCLWNLNQPESPYKAMYCDGEPRACGMSRLRAHVAFCGLAEGSVALWDLREKPMLHRTVLLGGGGVATSEDAKGGRSAPGATLVLRRPSFTTDNFSGENHAYPVRRVAALPQLAARTGFGGRGGGAGTAQDTGRTGFQIASMDDRGGTIVWTAVELQEGDLGGSVVDLGLNVGARVKLIKSSCIVAASDDVIGGDRALDLATPPADPGEFYVAAQSGVVTRCRRFGTQPEPRAYAALAAGAVAARFTAAIEGSGDWGLDADDDVAEDRAVARLRSASGRRTHVRLLQTVDAKVSGAKHSATAPTVLQLARPGASARRDACTCVAVSPFLPEYFAAGYADGRVCVFRNALASPVASWAATSSGGIVGVQWSSHRPGVLFALDKAGMLQYLDILRSTTASSGSEPLGPPAQRGKLATNIFALSSAAAAKGGPARSGTPPLLAYASSGAPAGTVHVRALAPGLAVADDEELEEVRACLLALE